MSEQPTWTFATCLKCRQMALVAPNGYRICPTCDEREARLRELLASVARPVVYQTLKSGLLGTTQLHQLRIAA